MGRDKTKYSELVKKHKDTLILQNESLFYTAYDEPAGVLSDITNFKLIRTATGKLRCSCHADKWESTRQLLEDNHISYIFIKKDEVVAEKIFKDNNYPLYANKKHIPDKIYEKETSKTNTGAVKNLNSYDDIEKYNKGLTYIELMCEGINPISNKKGNNISLEDPDIIRALFYIKELLEKYKIE